MSCYQGNLGSQPPCNCQTPLHPYHTQYTTASPTWWWQLLTHFNMIHPLAANTTMQSCSMPALTQPRALLWHYCVKLNWTAKQQQWQRLVDVTTTGHFIFPGPETGGDMTQPTRAQKGMQPHADCQKQVAYRGPLTSVLRGYLARRCYSSDKVTNWAPTIEEIRRRGIVW